MKKNKKKQQQQQKKPELNGCVYNFSVDYKTFDASDVIVIHKYCMKKHDIKCLVELNVYQIIN